jgi:hypothetical protein
MDALSNPEFIAKLEKLKETDPDQFMALVLESLKTFPDLAVEDNAPIENKRTALELMRRHFQDREDYEDCAFIRDLQKRINDAEKR